MSNTSTNSSTIISISALGIIRTIAGLPIEQPFQTLKTWMQAENQTAREAIHRIHKQKGVKGFYAGFWVSCLRNASKASYRWPLSVYLIHKFRQEFKKVGWGIGFAGTAAGLVTAVVESVILCPMERTKVWLMTSGSNNTYRAFWRLGLMKELYNGFWAVMAKQVLSWITFLGTQQYIKELIYKLEGKDPHEYELSYRQLALVSMGVCLVNTFVVMPADFIKTHYQRFNDHPYQKPTLGDFIRETIKTKGIKGFYRGTSVKLMHYNFNAMITVPMMEKMIRMMDGSAKQ